MRRRQSTPQGPEPEPPTYPIVGGDPMGPPPPPPPMAAPPPLASPANGSATIRRFSPPLPPPPSSNGNGTFLTIESPEQQQAPKPIVIQPPIPPQHVYAPMPALGALSIGFLSKKNKKKDDDDFKLLTNGSIFRYSGESSKCMLVFFGPMAHMIRCDRIYNLS